MRKSTRNDAGFTLIELLVAIAVIGIFAVIGIPSYQSLTTTNRMATEINGLVGDLQYTRSEAVMRGVNVTMCASSDMQTCNSPSSGWNAGWIVTASSSTTIPPLRVHQAMTSSDTFVANGGPLLSITFNRNGFTSNAGTISLHDSADTVSRRQCVVISTVGRVRLDTGSNCP